MHKRLGLTAIAAFALAASMAAQADTQPGFYAGAGVGTTKVSDDSFDSTGSMTAIRASRSSAAMPSTRTARSKSATSISARRARRTGRQLQRRRVRSDASAVGRLPLGDMFSLYGKLGYASYDVDANVQHRRLRQRVGQRQRVRPDLRRRRRAELRGTTSKRAEYEAINVGGGDANMMSVGGTYRF